MRKVVGVVPPISNLYSVIPNFEWTKSVLSFQGAGQCLLQTPKTVLDLTDSQLLVLRRNSTGLQCCPTVGVVWRRNLDLLGSSLRKELICLQCFFRYK